MHKRTAILVLFLVGCVRPSDVYLPSPVNTCTSFAKHYDAVLTTAPTNLTEFLPKAGSPSAEATLLWYSIAPESLLLCIYEPPDGCGSRSRVFRNISGAWQIEEDKGYDTVCLIH